MELSSVLARDNNATVDVKVPKRVLHFSDGTLEEYSDDDTDGVAPKGESIVDPKTLTWGPWFALKAWSAGSGTLAAVDYVGEFLASFFGITTPKYQYEIDEHERLEAQKKKLDELKAGWTEPENSNDLLTEQPSPAKVRV